MASFVILGIHDEEVGTVLGNVARVRMYINDQEYDEDFTLPELPRESGIPKTAEVYKYLLKDEIEKRMKELEEGNV